MEFVKGVQLKKIAEGKLVDIPADEVLDKSSIIFFYFSAHWCPPCRAFTPILKKFYDVSNCYSLINHMDLKI